MKMLVYNLLQSEDENGVILLEKRRQWSEANEEIAKKEAYNGVYEIVDDVIEIIEEPSQLDRIESQVAYLAMMTGNEDILEV